MDTRQWLLDQHGPVCAYCERRVSSRALKADQPFLAFLLARRARAASLLRYGSHLSQMLLDLAKEIAGPEAAARAARLADPDYPYLD